MVVLASVAESVFDWVMERKQDLGTFSLVRGCIFAVAFSFSCFFCPLRTWRQLVWFAVAF